MAEGERGGWLPPHGDDDEREKQGGMSSGDPLWSGPQPQQPQQPAPAPREEYGGFAPPTQSGWTPPPAGAQPSGQWGPPSQQPYYGPNASNGKATASLICGIVGIVLCQIFVFSIVAIVLGYQARNEIDASQGRQQNRGVATAGIITGWVGIVASVLVVVFVVIVGMNADTDEGDSVFSEPAIALLSALPL